MTSPSLTYGELERRLRDKHAAIVAENLRLREGMEQGRDVEPDLVDRATTFSSQDWAMIRYKRNVVLLKDIENALQAIRDGSYGWCELCGEFIGERRLLAVPSARYCIECQESLDGRMGLAWDRPVDVMAAAV